MTEVRLSVCPYRGPGYVLIASDDFEPVSAEAQWKIMRAGMSAVNLGAAGWQIPPFFHPLEKVGIGQFMLSPDIVEHMAPATNYMFKIVQPGQDDIDLVVPWKGIPGFRPGSDSVAFRPAAEPRPPHPQHTPEAPKLKPPVFHQAFAPPATVAVSEPIPNPPPLPTPSPAQVNPPPIAKPPRAPAALSERRLILCPNEACRQQILSSFTQCPWCKMDLTAGK